MQLIVMDSSGYLSAHLVATVGRYRGHVASHVADLDALRAVPVETPSTVVLGFMALDEEALRLLDSVRAAREDALIYVTAESIDHRMMFDALQRGATDVLTKPMLPVEILARAELAWEQRGVVARPPSNAVSFEDLAVDLDEARAIKAGTPLPLTRVELLLLHCLAAHPARVTPTERLLSVAGEAEELAPSALKSHVSRLRRKLSAAGGCPLEITSRKLLGYTLDVSTR